MTPEAANTAAIIETLKVAIIVKNSPIKNLVITDTIDNSKRINNAKNIEILSVSNLLGEALKRISNSTSVSDLFK